MESSKPAVEAPPHVVDYLQSAKTLTLATASPDGVPHASTLVFVNEGAALYVWIKTSSRTYQHLENNPRVAFTIAEYSEDWRQTKGAQGAGDAEVLEGIEIARVANEFGKKFPTLSPGQSTMGISFYRITPTDLEYIDNTRAEGAPSQEEFGAEYHRESVDLQ